jgi:hypothetical protein
MKNLYICDIILINLTLTMIHCMKRFLLLCTFCFITTWASAQSPEERATFLTNEMTTLLNLTPEQATKVNRINNRRYMIEAQLKERANASPAYFQAKANNFQSPVAQRYVTEYNRRKSEKEGRNDEVMTRIMTSAQIELYLQNKEALLQSVITEFGE